MSSLTLEEGYKLVKKNYCSTPHGQDPIHSPSLSPTPVRSSVSCLVLQSRSHQSHNFSNDAIKESQIILILVQTSRKRKSKRVLSWRPFPPHAYALPLLIYREIKLEPWNLLFFVEAPCHHFDCLHHHHHRHHHCHTWLSFIIINTINIQFHKISSASIANTAYTVYSVYTAYTAYITSTAHNAYTVITALEQKGYYAFTYDICNYIALWASKQKVEWLTGAD